MTDPADVAAEASTVSAGFAILTVQIVPFALPLLLLCIAPVLPLVVVGLVLAAIIYPPLRLVRHFRARKPRSASVASWNARHGHRPRPRSVADPS